MLHNFKKGRRRRETAAELCGAVSRRARDPAFYQAYGVADSIDGRFDVLALHAWLVLARLQDMGEDALAQDFVNALFARFDEALREQGSGDIGMGRRIKKMAGAFYGRLRAYSDSGDTAALADAILRNVYRGGPSRVEHAAALARYAIDARSRLAKSRPDMGGLDFGPLPADDPIP
jgi:cytochrome b pre-mRNA-processing protein 3